MSIRRREMKKRDRSRWRPFNHGYLKLAQRRETSISKFEKRRRATSTSSDENDEIRSLSEAGEVADELGPLTLHTIHLNFPPMAEHDVFDNGEPKTRTFYLI